jgi:UDP-glucose 4-epimerase
MTTTESVLVTGASGYIGSHCIVTLLEGEQEFNFTENQQDFKQSFSST